MFHEKAGSADKTLKLYEGYFHDLLADTGREGVIDDVVCWIDTQVTFMPAASGASSKSIRLLACMGRRKSTCICTLPVPLACDRKIAIGPAQRSASIQLR
jgi:hypothetical protein